MIKVKPLSLLSVSPRYAIRKTEIIDIHIKKAEFNYRNQKGSVNGKYSVFSQDMLCCQVCCCLCSAWAVLVSDVHYYSAAGHDGFDGSAGFMEGQYHAGKITGSGDRICKRQNTSRTISGPILYG